MSSLNGLESIEIWSARTDKLIRDMYKKSKETTRSATTVPFVTTEELERKLGSFGEQGWQLSGVKTTLRSSEGTVEEFTLTRRGLSTGNVVSSAMCVASVVSFAAYILPDACIDFTSKIVCSFDPDTEAKDSVSNLCLKGKFFDHMRPCETNKETMNVTFCLIDKKTF